MGLEQLNFESQTKEESAIELIRAWNPAPAKYQVCFSGGKDSVVVADLARRAMGDYDLVYNHTGLDYPEVIHFMRDNYPGIQITRPKRAVWAGVEYHGLPSRKVRWCCKELKEYSGKGRLLITGIRAAESPSRAKRCIVEINKRKDNKSFINPIFRWSDAEVWEYIKRHNLPYCSLYDQGYKRLGCILCPMESAQHTLDEWERQPKFAQAWFRAGFRYWERMSPKWKAKGSRFYTMFPDPESYVWKWLTRDQVSVDEMRYKAQQRGLTIIPGPSARGA